MIYEHIDLEIAIENLKMAAKKVIDFPPPNEPLSDLNFDHLKNDAEAVLHAIEIAERETLIQLLNTAISKIKISEIDHDTTTRGDLVARTKLLELFFAAQRAKDIALAAGYQNPEALDIDLADSRTASRLNEIDKKLMELQQQTANLENSIKSDHLEGISISLGPISFSVDALIGILKKSTESAKSYIAQNKMGNAQNIQTRFETVNSSAQTLMSAIIDRSKIFGRKIVNLSKKVAKAAADAYIGGLNLLKESISNKIKPEFLVRLETNFYNPVPDALISLDLKDSGGDYANAAGRIASNLIFMASKTNSGAYLHNAKISSCSISSDSKDRRIKFSLNDLEIIFDAVLSEKEYEVLSTAGEGHLFRMFRRSQEAMYG